MASTRTAAQATRTLATQATAPARPRRLSKRTARSSPSSARSSLTQLYHLTPTFVPTHNPAKLSTYLQSVLVPENAASARPKPQHLRDQVQAALLLDVQRVRLDASGSASTSLLGLDLSVPANELASTYNFDQAPFDHRESFFASFVKGSEPPLAKRTRQVVDVLHGTQAGGRAGPATLEEVGERAVQWREGLGQAREEARRLEDRIDRDAEEFSAAFEATGQEQARA
ncbi:hypothetical protein JCM10207_008046 [Rhodosporidiobolus poonsookiae]